MLNTTTVFKLLNFELVIFSLKLENLLSLVKEIHIGVAQCPLQFCNLLVPYTQFPSSTM